MCTHVYWKTYQLPPSLPLPPQVVKTIATNKYEFRKSFTLLNSQVIEFYTNSKRERERRETDRETERWATCLKTAHTKR